MRASGIVALTLGLVVLGGAAPGPTTASGTPLAGATSDGVDLVGHSDLGGGGMNGDVAVLGSTAFVARGLLPSIAVVSGTRNPARCPWSAHADPPMVVPPATVTIVDLADPSAPEVVGEIPLAPGHAAVGVDALRVSGPRPYDLLAVALVGCGTTAVPFERGVHYYDVTDPARPLPLGRYRADLGDPANVVPVASSQYAVTLVEHGDRILSLSTEPYASASSYSSGDLRIVDVTQPLVPVEIGSFHPVEPGRFFSRNGCRPYLAGVHAAATGGRAFLAGYDAGLFALDLSDPSAPQLEGRFSYPDDVHVEGNAAHVALAEIDGRSIGILAEDDFVAPTTEVIVDDGSEIVTYRGCEAAFTLFEPTGTAPVYAHPGSEISGEVVYVGRACPAGQSGIGVSAGDPLLTDPRGKIALADRGGCNFDGKIRRLNDAGATAVILRDTTSFPIFSADGSPEAARIPMVMVGQLDGSLIRDSIAQGPVHLTLRDNPGSWGGVRIFDLSGAPAQLASFHTADAVAFPPPDGGIYSVARSVVDGSLGWLAWNSAGVRLVDLSNPAAPEETGWFVPPDSSDPTGNLPPKALVRGVALLDHDGERLGVITDVHGGLYVVRTTG